MPRLIDAEELLAEYDRQHVGEPGRARKLIEDAPTINAVPVVRCKDCKERCPESATSVQHCTLSGIQTEDDDFCSYGARKGE